MSSIHQVKTGGPDLCHVMEQEDTSLEVERNYVKPEDTIQEEFKVFERSMNDIDSKFSRLNQNIEMY